MSNILNRGRAYKFVFHRVRFLSVALAVLIVLPCVCSAEIDWSISASVANKPARVRLNPIELGAVNQIWGQIIVGYYHVNIDFVNSLYDRGYGFDEIACLLEMAKASKKDRAGIAALRRGGLGWGAIAKRLGVNPATMERAKGRDSLFKRYVLAQCLAGYYRIPDREALVLLNEKGYGFDEIGIAANVSAHSGAPLRDVIAARATGAKWRVVAEKFKMSPANLGTPPAAYSGAGTKEKGEGKVKETGSGKIKETGSKKKSRTADCSATCPRKCY